MLSMVHQIFKILGNLPAFQTFSRLSRRIFGVNIALVSANGKEGRRLGTPKDYNSFCTTLQRSKRFKQACLQCDQEHFQKVWQLKKSLGYTCYFGLKDFIIPIIVDKEITAFMQCGQVLNRHPTRKQWDLIRAKISKEGLDITALEQLFYQTRIVSRQTQRDLIQLLEIFANYIASTSQRLLLLERGRDSQSVLLAKSYIKEHLLENIKLDSVARAAFSSTRNLTRVFRAETGMTIMGYTYRLRIEQACEQLLTTRKKILQVALESGFNNIQHFNRVFRRLKHCTPSAWHKRHWHNGS